MLDEWISPPVMLGIVLFIAIYWVVRVWLLSDAGERRRQDRRGVSTEQEFPFYDSQGDWVTNERRQRSDRRRPRTFVVKQTEPLQK